MVVPDMTESKREEVLKLMSEKDKIEREIRELTAVLTSNNIGMTEPLVDEQGFPLSNVDVYQVRNARHRIICLQNDHKALMMKIESGLYEVHALKKAVNESNPSNISLKSPPSLSNEDVNMDENLTPIAKVNMVREGSPADIDGIRLDDLIIEFGSVNSTNFRELADISNVVQHSQNKSLTVKLLRNKRVCSITLTPRTWVGRGLLGCNIIPLDNVER